jgi:hypothetical protein
LDLELALDLGLKIVSDGLMVLVTPVGNALFVSDCVQEKSCKKNVLFCDRRKTIVTGGACYGATPNWADFASVDAAP